MAQACSVGVRRLAVIGVALGGCFGPPALGWDVLNVPAEYPTIQAGIDAAVDDDIVLVAPGTYSGSGNVDLDYAGKSITVRGSNRESVITDEAGGTRAVRFNTAESPLSVFEGFTIQFNSGQGIVIRSSDPTIRDCTVFAENQSPLVMVQSDSTLTDVALEGLREPAQILRGSPTLDRVTITGTSIEMRSTDILLIDCIAENNDSGLGFTGGGLSIRNSSAVLERCIVRNNLTFGEEGYFSFGGGVYVEESDVRFIACRIEDNHAIGHHQKVHGDGGGAYLLNSEAEFEACVLIGNSGTRGGGVYVEGGNATFFDCFFASNQAFISGGGAHGSGEFEQCEFQLNFGQEVGGGAYSNGAVFRRCIFRDNRTSHYLYEDYDGGAGIWTGTGPTIVLDSLFRGNVASSDDAVGGGIRAGDGDVIRGCTFVSNSATMEGGGVSFSGVGATVANCIFRGNTNRGGPSEIDGPGEVVWSNVEGGYAGEGNIDLDPLFVNPESDFRLSAGSPCIDAGDNRRVPAESVADLGGLARFVDDPGMPNMGEGEGPLVDMGCHEFQGETAGLQLRANAECPQGGAVRVGWANATPSARAILVFARTTGAVTIPNGRPCAGTVLGLGSQGLRVVLDRNSDKSGGLVINSIAPAAACGGYLQLIDITRCDVSDVAPLR